MKLFLKSNSQIPRYRGSPTYAVFTTADPTTAVFGLCMCKWGFFALVRVTQFFSSPKIRGSWGPSVLPNLKLRHCEKATKCGKKISHLFWRYWTNVKTNFCGLFRKPELYDSIYMKLLSTCLWRLRYIRYKCDFKIGFTPFVTTR